MVTWPEPFSFSIVSYSIFALLYFRLLPWFHRCIGFLFNILNRCNWLIVGLVFVVFVLSPWSSPICCGCYTILHASQVTGLRYNCVTSQTVDIRSPFFCLILWWGHRKAIFARRWFYLSVVTKPTTLTGTGEPGTSRRYITVKPEHGCVWGQCPFSALPCFGHQSILGICPEPGAVPHHTLISTTRGTKIRSQASQAASQSE